MTDPITRQSAHPLDGIINFNKPVGITSAKMLYKVRSLTGQRKSGHAGTLDPAAAGVLVLCLGRATKLVEAVMDQPKVYRATARLDVTSESFDCDRPLIPVEVADPPTHEALLAACRTLEGVIEQVPPRISAIKVGGVPSYKRTAKEPALELTSRKVRIDWLHIHTYTWPTIDFELACGRGTYVRSVIRDLGACFGAGGCLTSLVRRRVGPFAVEQAWSLEGLRQASAPGEYLIDFDSAERLLDPASIVIPPRPTPEQVDGRAVCPSTSHWLNRA